MSKLNFEVPFSGFAATTFINCFSSVYLYLEGIMSKGENITFCNQWENGACNGCGNCGTKPQAIQERYFFLFDTMSGHSALRCHFDGTPTEMDQMINDKAFYDGGSADNIDFLFGFTGYSYQTITDSKLFASAVLESMEANRPVIAKLKDCNVPFCVITGYEGDAFVCPSFKGAQKYIDHAPLCSEIGSIYVIGEKTTPKYTLIDGLKRINRVLEYNNSHNLWGEYTERLGKYGPNGLDSVDAEGKKARMKRVSDTMWHTFNCHNFGEVFRSFAGGNNHSYDMVCDVSKLNTLSCKEYIEKIGFPLCGYTHDLAWALIGLQECVNWNSYSAGYFGEMIELTLSQIKKNDADTLAAIQELIKILSE